MSQQCKILKYFTEQNFPTDFGFEVIYWNYEKEKSMKLKKIRKSMKLSFTNPYKINTANLQKIQMNFVAN